MSQEKQRQISTLFRWGMIGTIMGGVGTALTHSWWMCIAMIGQVITLLMFRHAVIQAMKKL